MAMTKVELNQAFREASSLEFENIPCEEEQVGFVFSDKFIRKMEKLICNQKKSYWEYVNTGKKRIAIAAIICLSVLVTACSSSQFREVFFQQVEKWGGQAVSHILEGDIRTLILYEYQLNSLPDGVKLIDKSRSFKNVEKIYSDVNDNRIRFSQSAEEDPYFILMNEWSEQYKMEIRGLEMTIYEFPDSLAGIWVEDGYGMMLIYDGCTDLDVFIEIIEGIK
jgi:hypothetical protein